MMLMYCIEVVFWHVVNTVEQTSFIRHVDVVDSCLYKKSAFLQAIASIGVGIKLHSDSHYIACIGSLLGIDTDKKLYLYIWFI